MGMETVFLGLLGLGILVFFHELGHFAAARWFKIEVEAFSVGMGPVLLRKKIGQTEYRLSLIPLGGYCKMKGEQFLLSALENPHAEPTPEPGSFYSAAPWQRIIVAAAGPVFNLLLTVAIFFSLGLTAVPYKGAEAVIQPISTQYLSPLFQHFYPWAPQWAEFQLPGEKAGLQAGDRVLKVNTEEIESFQDFQDRLNNLSSGPVNLTILREGQLLTIPVDPIQDPRQKTGKKGLVVGISPFEPPVVHGVLPRSDAALAGLQDGDKILSVNSNPVTSAREALGRLRSAPEGTKASLLVERGGNTLPLTMVISAPRSSDFPGIDFLPIFYRPAMSAGESLLQAWNDTWELITGTLQGLAQLFVKFNFSESLSGPIGVVMTAGSIAQSGFADSFALGLVTFLNISAFLSIGLFIMNLLPIPVLDGGTIVLNLVQMFVKKPFKPLVYIRYQQVGMFFVLALLVFTTANDIFKFPFM